MKVSEKIDFIARLAIVDYIIQYSIIKVEPPHNEPA